MLKNVGFKLTTLKRSENATVKLCGNEKRLAQIKIADNYNKHGRKWQNQALQNLTKPYLYQLRKTKYYGLGITRQQRLLLPERMD